MIVVIMYRRDKTNDSQLHLMVRQGSAGKEVTPRFRGPARLFIY